MTENELSTELEENGWEGRIGGHSKSNYIHKISNQEGYGVFVNLKETFLAIFFIYWKNMNSKEYETKIIGNPIEPILSPSKIMYLTSLHLKPWIQNL